MTFVGYLPMEYEYYDDDMSANDGQMTSQAMTSLTPPWIEASIGHTMVARVSTKTSSQHGCLLIGSGQSQSTQPYSFTVYADAFYTEDGNGVVWYVWAVAFEIQHLLQTPYFECMTFVGYLPVEYEYYDDHLWANDGQMTSQAMISSTLPWIEASIGMTGKSLNNGFAAIPSHLYLWEYTLGSVSTTGGVRTFPLSLSTSAATAVDPVTSIQGPEKLSECSLNPQPKEDVKAAEDEKETYEVDPLAKKKKNKKKNWRWWEDKKNGKKRIEGNKGDKEATQRNTGIEPVKKKNVKKAAVKNDCMHEKSPVEKKKMVSKPNKRQRRRKREALAAAAAAAAAAASDKCSMTFPSK